MAHSLSHNGGFARIIGSPKADTRGAEHAQSTSVGFCVGSRRSHQSELGEEATRKASLQVRAKQRAAGLAPPSRGRPDPASSLACAGTGGDRYGQRLRFVCETGRSVIGFLTVSPVPEVDCGFVSSTARTLRCLRISFACAMAALSGVSPRPSIAGAPDAGSTPAPAQAQVLTTIGGPSYAYELVLDGCGRASRHAGAPATCAMKVRLLVGGKVADSATFGEPACGPARPTSVDGLFGVSLDTPGWATAGPGCDEAMAAKAVRVGPNEVGLLVTQRDGGEHVGHQHWFFVNRGGKLFAAWSPASDNRSGFDARVVSAPGGAYEDLALIDVVGVDGDADQAIERVVVRRLHWDAQSGGMVVSAMPDPDFPLYLVFVGPFRTAAAAREAGDPRYPKCSVPFRALPASLFPGLGLRGVLRGAVFTSREEAEVAKGAAGPCPPALRTKIIEYVPKVEYEPRK